MTLNENHSPTSGRRGQRFLPAVLVALCCTASISFAKWSFGDGIGGDTSGGDQTIGTLPMHDNGGDDTFDQTVTLRGAESVLARAIVAATGDGWVERIELGENTDGDEEVWYRFFGDIRVELDLASLAEVDVEIFSGFDGGGMTYAVGQGGYFGSATSIGSGATIDLDPIRLANGGLLDQTVLVLGLHGTGNRTLTSIDRLVGAGAAGTGTVVLFQDV